VSVYDALVHIKFDFDFLFVSIDQRNLYTSGANSLIVCLSISHARQRFNVCFFSLNIIVASNDAAMLI
jgi:hypothetical protein